MARIVVYDPSDTVVADRVTEFNPSAHGADYSGESNKLENPDLSSLWTAPNTFIVALKYWKRSGSTVIEMSAGEKTSIDSSYESQREAVMGRVRNTSGVTIDDGTPVYITGVDTDAGVPEVAAADAGTASKMPSIGVACCDMLDDAYGDVVRVGFVTSVDTAGSSLNDVVYVADGGGLTVTAPGADKTRQRLGVVSKVGVEGEVAIDIHDTRHTLDDIGDVEITTPASGEFLKFDGTDWVNDDVPSGASSDTLASWSLSAGDLYYQTFAHNLGTTDVSVFCYNTTGSKQVFPEDVEIVDTNTVKIWVRGNSHSMKVNVVTGRGPQGPAGPAGGGMANMVEDTSPQLGGNLGMNGFTIAGATETELGYVDGVTSAIQTQINGKTATGHTHTEANITDLGSYIENVVEDTTPQLGGDLDLNQKYIKLDPTPNSDHTGNGIMATMQVDVNGVGVRAALHLDTDGNFILADADNASTMPCMALAIESGTGSKKVLLQGFYRDDSWSWSVGGPIYVSTSGGGLTQTAPSGTGDQVQRVGIATHADRIWFNPDLTVIEIV